MSIYQNLSDALGIEHIPSNEEYNENNFIEYSKGMSAFAGKKHTEESKKLTSEKLKGRVLSEETKKKLSVVASNRVKNRTHHCLSYNGGSERSRKVALKRSSEGTNPLQNRPKINCPHCNKIGDSFLMKRWHFDNCKQKP